MLHGWGMNSAVFTPLAQEIETSVTCHIKNLPGHGNAALANCSHSDSAAQIADAWIEQLIAAAPPQFFVLGWSLGGLLAIKIAELYPRRVLGTLLIATAPKFVSTGNWQAIANSEMSNFAQQLKRDPITTVRSFLALQCLGATDSKKSMRYLLYSLKKHGKPLPQALKQGLKLLKEMDMRQQYQSLHPAAVIFGECDQLISSDTQQQMLKLNLKAQSSVIANAGHAPHLSHPKPTASAVLKLINTANYE